MGKIKGLLWIVSILLLHFHLSLTPTSAEEETEKSKEQLELPKHVLSITKVNTFPNPAEEMTVVEPSPLTERLLETIDESIENPEVIKLLNDSNVKTSPFSFGYQADIYLGRWPLYYESTSSSIIWDYQHINTNELNNRHSNEGQELTYIQEEEVEVKGALMNQVADPEGIKKLILEKTNAKLPYTVSFSTKVGRNTKLQDVYKVGVNKIGQLDAYVPAINEKGQVVYGDLYIHSKGSQVELQIKHVTKHGIGAWLPIQDHVALTYKLR